MKILKKVIKTIIEDEKGEGFVDVLIKMLIVVVIGAALLGIMKIAIPEIFNDIIATIRSVFVI